jgi:hypothetical protein
MASLRYSEWDSMCTKCMLTFRNFCVQQSTYTEHVLLRAGDLPLFRLQIMKNFLSCIMVDTIKSLQPAGMLVTTPIYLSDFSELHSNYC